MSIYRPFGRFWRRVYRLANPEGKAAGPQPPAPAVFLIQHRNLSGPIHAVAHLPVEGHIWVLKVFLDRRECFDQYYRYTYTERFGWPKPAAFLMAGLLSFVIPPFVRSFSPIHVYRGHADIRDTMARSLSALLAGENIIICPDTDYSNASPEMGEVYMGFLKLEQDYYAQTGRHLTFVPTYCSTLQSRLALGQPVYFQDGEPFRPGRKRVAQELRNRVNQLGRECGDIPKPDNGPAPSPETMA